MKTQYLVLVIGVISVSCAATFIRIADAPPLVIAAWRMCLAALIVVPAALLRSRKELLSLRGKDLAFMLLAGLFLALHFALWIASLSYTSVATSVILVTANPVFVSLASYLIFRERMTRQIVTGIVISIAGTVVIGYSNWNLGPNPLLGAGLALLGAFTIAIYLLIGRRLRRTTGLLAYSAVTYGSSAVFLLIAALIAGYSFFGYSPVTWGMLALLALIPQIIGHTSLNWSLKYMPATMVTIAVLGEPVIASLLAVAFLGETPLVSEIAGGVLIFAGIGIAFRHNRAVMA